MSEYLAQPPIGCDMDVYDDMIDEGMSELEAWTVVNTEMDGALETEYGGIHAWQTACNVLDYDEALPESESLTDTHPADEVDDNTPLLSLPGGYSPGDIVTWNDEEYTVVGGRRTVDMGQNFDGSHTTLPLTIQLQDKDGGIIEVDPRNPNLGDD